MGAPNAYGRTAELAPSVINGGRQYIASGAAGYSVAWRTVVGISFGTACLFALLYLFTESLQASSALEPAAQLSGSRRADTQADFLASCSVLPHIQSIPAQDRVTVSPVAGGELRLRPTLEDYFDGATIDSTKWISGYTNPSFPNAPAPEVVNGAVRLDANFLRAVEPFGAEMPVRFFEASARFVTSPHPIAYADIGFYRSMPPLRVLTETGSIRLFVGQRTVESATPRHLYVRSKDGLFLPSMASSENATDTIVDNWGPDPQAQMSALNRAHTFEILWDQHVTKYLIDGSEVITAAEGQSKPLPHAGISSLPTYVSMFSQDPTTFGGGVSPLLVDWVRAGAYPGQGVYTSCIEDAGEVVNWSRMAISANIPAGTALTIETRTSVDGTSWSGWIATKATTSGTISLSGAGLPGGRYFQYRVLLKSQDPLLTPEVNRLEAFYFKPKSIDVKPDVAYVNPDSQVFFSTYVLDANGELILGHQVPVSWSVAFGGGVIGEDGLFTAGSTSGRFTDTVRATSPGLGTDPATVNIGNAPALNLSPEFDGVEGAPTTLIASATRAGDDLPLRLDWDLDNDGLFDDKTGDIITYTFPKAGIYPIHVIATSAVGFTNTAQSIATIQNVTPRILAINVSAPTGRRKETSVEIIAEDVPAAILTYSFDWDNNGLFEVADQSSNTASSVLDRSADRIIAVRVRDDNGGETVDTATIRAIPNRVYVPIVTR